MPRTSRPLGVVLAVVLVATTAAGLAAGPAGAAAAAVTVTAAYPGDTAVKGGQSIAVSGDLPDGPPTAAVLEGTGADGGLLVAVPAQPSALTWSAGRVSGQLGLPCQFAGPEQAAGCAPSQDVRSVRLVLCTAASSADPAVCARPDAAGRTVSNGYRVDYTQPFVRGYEVVAPDRVRVVLSEPVRQPDGDNPLDWTVTSPDRRVRQVLPAVEGDCVGRYLPGEDAAAGSTGCTRTLVLDLPLGEDDQPVVSYANAPLPGRYRYEDGNRNSALGANPGATSAARDVLPPAAPSITAVAGRSTSSGRVDGADRRPSVALGNLTGGQDVQVVGRLADGTRAFATPWTTASGTTSTVVLPELAGPGEVVEYVLTARARDPHGNVSTGRGDGPRADGTPNPVTYALDAQVPSLVSALVRGAQVAVTVSEAVAGSNSPLDWTLTAPSGVMSRPSMVSGSGAERVLDVTGPAGSVVAYTPAPTSTRYADAAGNPVADASLPLGVVDAPVVTVPAARTFTRAAAVTVSGTSGDGTVEIGRDTTGDGQPDGGPLATTTASGGSFSVRVPLGDDGSYALTAVRVTGTGRSTPVAVPVVVRDTVAPAVHLTSPVGGEVYAGGSGQTVRYDASDADPPPGLVRVELSLDGGASWADLSAGTSGGSLAWTVPTTDTASALVRLTATDLAGNSATDRSATTFTVDAIPPTLSARTRDAGTVVVTFSEPVSGTVSPLDWTVKGVRAAQATADGATGAGSSTGVRTVVLTLPPGVTLGPDELPTVVYAPSPAATAFTDRAGQPVPGAARSVQASDGIAPGAPVLRTPGSAVLTREDAVGVTGSAGPAGGSVEAVTSGGSPLAAAPVATDGTWSVSVPLPRDTTTDLRVRAVDTHGNRSATAAAVPPVEQDGTDPVVAVTAPRSGDRLEPGSRVTVRWTSSDKNLLDGQTLVEVSTDGGRTRTVLGDHQPATGSLVWTVPTAVTPDASVRVGTPDRAGRTGTGAAAPLGIGTAAASASPSPSPSSSGGPAGPLPPVRQLTVQVSPGTTVPGRPVTVTVTGDPGRPVELRAYSRPSTTYATARTGTLGPDGRLSWAVHPGTNTRLYARATDASGSEDSRSAVISVQTVMSLTVVRTARRSYVFQGRLLPRRAAQLVTLYRVDARGREIITSQIRSDDSGTYRIPRVFTGSGRFGFLTRTGQNLTNAAGASNDGRARPTDVF